MKVEVGNKLREARIRKGITLKDLAKQTGLTTSFISQVERNIVSPSLNSLKRIADSLNLKMSSLFDEDLKKELIFIKKASRKKISISKSKAAYEVMASGLLNINMRPLLLTLAVGGRIERKLSLNEEEEFGFIVQGKIELARQDKVFQMEEGDAIYFVSSRPYEIKNSGDTEALILWVACVSLFQKQA